MVSTSPRRRRSSRTLSRKRSLTLITPQANSVTSRWVYPTVSGFWWSLTRRRAIVSGSSQHAAARGQNEELMKKEPEEPTVEEMRAEYDFSEGVRGEYASRFAEGIHE